MSSGVWSSFCAETEALRLSCCIGAHYTLLLSFCFSRDSSMNAKSLTLDDTQGWLRLDVKLDAFGICSLRASFQRLKP